MPSIVKSLVSNKETASAVALESIFGSEEYNNRERNLHKKTAYMPYEISIVVSLFRILTLHV
jgi:hypothetical protein